MGQYVDVYQYFSRTESAIHHCGFCDPSNWCDGVYLRRSGEGGGTTAIECIAIVTAVPSINIKIQISLQVKIVPQPTSHPPPYHRQTTLPVVPEIR